MFNNGFHTAHHEQPGAHWSRLPGLHARISHEIDPDLCPVEPARLLLAVLRARGDLARVSYQASRAASIRCRPRAGVPSQEHGRHVTSRAVRVVYVALVPVLAWACYRAEPSAAPCPKREPPAPAPTVVVTNVGCFRDQGNRDLDGMMLEARGMTTEACTRECAEWGYRFAGTENGNQCFCGNAFGKYGASTDCTKPCVGRPDETCGGFWAHSVYQVQRLEGAAPVPSTVVIPVPPAQSVALAPPPPAPVRHDPDSHFTEAEVIERQASIPLGAEWKPLPNVTRGTWWTEYVSQPQSVHDACAAAVVSRFGEGWQLAGLHAYLGTATLVSRTNLARRARRAGTRRAADGPVPRHGPPHPRALSASRRPLRTARR